VRRARVAALAGLLLLFVPAARASDPPTPSEVLTPVEHRRPADQTFLTFPEWFLVHSPNEYAALTREEHPSRFPFAGHIGQLWSSYASVTEATADQPFNAGYHLMILVIATSTTVEYGIRGIYETLIGRLAEATAGPGFTPEEQLGADVAQEYVDFINVRPWYEFDFVGALGRLWTDVPLVGHDMIRKWERRYALTSEYLAKAVYGVLIREATHATYETPSEVTAVVLDGLSEAPPGVDLVVLQRLDDGGALATLPRYEAFGRHASILASRGVRFREVAGNRGDILVSAIVPQGTSHTLGARVLFVQPILTRMHEERAVLVLPVAQLADVLVRLRRSDCRLEHVYDY
jgi:hypothetical protein